MYIIMGIIICGIIFVFIKEMTKPIEDDGTFKIKLLHISGNPYLPSEEIILQLKDNIMNFIHKEEIKDSINIFDLIEFDIKTETQIKQSVTLPRVLFLGLASLAFKKQSEINNMYLVLKYKIKNIEIKCVFKNIHNDDIGIIISTINKIRIENS